MKEEFELFMLDIEVIYAKNFTNEPIKIMV